MVLADLREGAIDNDRKLDERTVVEIESDIDRFVDQIYEDYRAQENEVEEAFKRVAENRFNMRRPVEDTPDEEPESPENSLP